MAARSLLGIAPDYVQFLQIGDKVGCAGRPVGRTMRQRLPSCRTAHQMISDRLSRMVLLRLDTAAGLLLAGFTHSQMAVGNEGMAERMAACAACHGVQGRTTRDGNAPRQPYRMPS